MTSTVNPSVYYFKTWETGEGAGFQWAGETRKGTALIALDFGPTRESVEHKQDAYVAWLTERELAGV